MTDQFITPEAVALDLEPATVGSRSVALLLDQLLIGAGLLLLTAAQAAFGFGGFVPDWLGIALLLLLAFGLQFGYPVGFETLWRGRTPGKAALGLRVITVEGAPVRFRHAAVRAAVGLVELQATLGGIAVISSLASRNGQRLGDLAAGTLVVRERQAAGPPAPVTFAPPAGLEAYARALDVSRVSARDYATVRELLRRPMEPAVRARIARELADGLVDHVQPPPPAGVEPVPWLQAVAAAVQARHARTPGEPGPPGSGPATPGSRAWNPSPPAGASWSPSGAGTTQPEPPPDAEMPSSSPHPAQGPTPSVDDEGGFRPPS